ncbi:hypothetical protein PG990_004124 [Apiospora arundinis]
MHQSSFSYNVTRAYPFKWFTPTVIIGGILTAILVSFINFASSGYELVATSSNNPNGTVSDLSRLERCNVTEVNIDVLGRFTQSPRNTASSGAGVLVHASARCAVDIITSSTESAMGPTYVEMRGTYEAAVYPNIKTFLSRNKTESPSLYWGESILRTYSALTAKTYMLNKNDRDKKLAEERRFNAAIILERRANGTNNDTYEETMRNDFFRVRCFVEGNVCSTDDIPSLAAPEKDSWMHPYPNIWNRVNLLGKGMWHTVLADLGRNESGVPNMLTQPELLANLTGGLASEVAWYNDMSIMPKGMQATSELRGHRRVLFGKLYLPGPTDENGGYFVFIYSGSGSGVAPGCLIDISIHCGHACAAQRPDPTTLRRMQPLSEHGTCRSEEVELDDRTGGVQ